jgi:hypothetical protein
VARANSHFVNEYLYGDSISPRLAGFSSSIGPLVLNGLRLPVPPAVEDWLQHSPSKMNLLTALSEFW